jgi:acetyl esterase/lipase
VTDSVASVSAKQSNLISTTHLRPLGDAMRLVSTVLRLFVCCALVGSSSVRADDPKKLDLWNGHAALGDGKTEEAAVEITIYPAAKPNGAAVVICPGGGYGGHAIQPEGHGIAKWLNDHGVMGVVLQYRLPKGRHQVPLLDAQRAIRTVRANAKEWGIDPARVGIIGFSAGGHLASTAATHFDGGDSNAADAIDRESSRPDFAILVYPVISMGEKTHQGSRNNLLGPNPSKELIELYSNEKQVTDKTPPIFLAHPQDDTVVVPANSQMMQQALEDKKIPSRYLQLESGGHGLNGYKGPMWDAWQKLSLQWLAELKMIPEKDGATPLK